MFDVADGARWSQLVARSQAATFTYGVKSTNIFCRASCGARLPRRANVEFFEDAVQAEAAGYRACKRCKPLLPVYRPEADKIQKVCNLLETLPRDAPLPGLERLAKEAGLTKHHFHRMFRRETGLTPRQYALSRREGSRSDPSTSSAVTPSASLDAAFTPPVRSDETFEEFLHIDPDLFEDFKFPSSQELREMVIYHEIVTSIYGPLLVAFQDRKVCKLELGSHVELMAGLEKQYPSQSHIHSPIADASYDAHLFRQQIVDILAALEKPCGKVVDVAMAFELPLKVAMESLHSGHQDQVLQHLEGV